MKITVKYLHPWIKMKNHSRPTLLNNGKLHRMSWWDQSCILMTEPWWAPPMRVMKSPWSPMVPPYAQWVPNMSPLWWLEPSLIYIIHHLDQVPVQLPPCVTVVQILCRKGSSWIYNFGGWSFRWPPTKDANVLQWCEMGGIKFWNRSSILKL